VGLLLVAVLHDFLHKSNFPFNPPHIERPVACSEPSFINVDGRVQRAEFFQEPFTQPFSNLANGFRELFLDFKTDSKMMLCKSFGN